MIKVIPLRHYVCAMAIAVSTLSVWAASADPVSPTIDFNAAKTNTGYVAKNESIQFLFNALSTESKRPYVLSKLAQKKTVTGDFDISNPSKFLDKISTQIGLVWYDDGQSFYVYDNSELKNAVVMLRAATLTTLNEFLTRTGLASARYPIRGEPRNNAFYVAGPPAYVDIVVNAAAYLDDLYKNVDLNKQRIAIIKLQNTFVTDRKLKIRDQEITVAGIGRVIEAILSNERRELITIDTAPASGGSAANNAGDKKTMNEVSQIKVIPFPDTNSLLVKGTQEQIDLIQTLVEQLDVPKRHIELSLWIIDINKSDLDALGINWQGGINLGKNAGISLNTSGALLDSTVDGTRFLAQITALNKKGGAEIVSRPIVLTQDNVPASFDHNSTFYTKLEGERVASLDSVTFGTMINVLPRFSPKGDEVEMILDIEDGQRQDASSDVNSIPSVTRTKLSTIARVPRDMSLLIGGYTRDETTRANSKVPFLGDLPYIGGAFRNESKSDTKLVRVFLIQPKLLEIGAAWNPGLFTAPSSLAPQMPLEQTLQLLKNYSTTPDVNN